MSGTRSPRSPTRRTSPTGPPRTWRPDPPRRVDHRGSTARPASVPPPVRAHGGRGPERRGAGPRSCYLPPP
ncbi:hypothetical protein FTX61_12115 [Nitriliruptoraceae bacterium ZYF776]|nr:hypothetical protein [Profundirhabdus halotolerans]